MIALFTVCVAKRVPTIDVRGGRPSLLRILAAALAALSFSGARVILARLQLFLRACGT